LESVGNCTVGEGVSRDGVGRVADLLGAHVAGLTPEDLVFTTAQGDGRKSRR